MPFVTSLVAGGLPSPLHGALRVGCCVLGLGLADLGAGSVGDCGDAGAPEGQALGFMASYAADVCLGPMGATGVAVVLSTPGGNLGLGAAGLADAANDLEVEALTLFRVGPLTDLFTAALVLRLVDASLLDLTDTLADHLPAASTDLPITLRDLLAHRSGLRDYTTISGLDRAAPGDPTAVLLDVIRRGLTQDPGTKDADSRTNGLALGLVVESVLGVPYGQALHEHVLDPFGLGATVVDGFEPTPDTLALGHDAQDRPASEAIHPTLLGGALSVASTTTDVERLARLILEDEAFLLAATRQEALFPAGGAFGEDGHGFGVRLAHRDGDETVEAGGRHPSGYGASLVCLRDDGACAVVLATGRPANTALGAEVGARYAQGTLPAEP